MGIEWQEGAVCFAGGEQWFVNSLGDDKRYQLKNFSGASLYSFYGVINFAKHFQLNTIKQGDYIEASELNTEQKYNDVAEVFVLFGFKPYKNHRGYNKYKENLSLGDDCFCYSSIGLKRKLTYQQIMAIGELKRLEIERDKSAPKAAPDLTPDLGIVSSNKYEREITDRRGNSAIVDVYDVLKAFEVACPATQHALKKLLCSGLRGHKDLQTDLLEAKESITRAIELNE